MRRFLVPLVCLACSLIPRDAAARARADAVGATPAPRSFTLERALTLATFSDLTWSRDGRRLAFVATTVDTAENTTDQDLWLVDADAPSPRPLRLTRHPKADWSPTFSPGGDTLAFVSVRGAGDDARSAIYFLSLSGGEPWAFGAYDESINEVKWSPDGRWLAFVEIDTLASAVREQRKKRWDQTVEDERLQYPHLRVIEIATGKQRRLTSGAQYVWNLRWSPDSRAIAFLTSPTGKPDDGNLADIGVVPLAGGAMRKLGVIGSEFEWSPNGKWIACATSRNRERYVDKSDVWIVPVAGGAPIDLTRDFDEDGKTPCWNPTSDTLFFHSTQAATTMLAAVAVPRDPSARRAGSPPSVVLLTDRDAESGTPVAARNGRIAWVQSRANRPGEIWNADHPRLAGRAATAFNADVAALELGTTQRVAWRSSDGVEVEGLLLRPPGAAAHGALKTLVQLHGGPYADRIGLGFQALPQYLAANGYQIFMPNFRSSGGYGTAFMVRERADWGGQDWRDVTTGLDTLIADGLADGQRLAVFGRSYGGYLTAWAITQTDRFDAAAVFAGAADLASLYGESDIQKYRAYEFEGFPWVTRDRWEKSSPITYADRVRTPTLIQVGDNDRRVPASQSLQLYRALLAVQVPVEYVHYPREGHALREPRHRADQMRRMVAWFDRWVK